MDERALRELEIRQKVVFTRGKGLSKLVANAVVVGPITRSSVRIRITEILESDIFHSNYRVGSVENAKLDELSLE